MRGLVGRGFIYGTIVHHAQEVTTQDLTVQTAAFLKCHMLARNQAMVFCLGTQNLGEEPSGGVHGHNGVAAPGHRVLK